MTDEPLLTRVDLAVLSSLTGRPTSAHDLLIFGGLYPASFPIANSKLNAKLGSLAARSLARKGDTGGPKSKARTVWSITAAGQNVLDAYHANHPKGAPHVPIRQ